MIMPIIHNEDPVGTSSVPKVPTARTSANSFDSYDRFIVAICIVVFIAIIVCSVARVAGLFKRNANGWNLQRALQELEFPTVPLYTPRATGKDLGTFDKAGNLIPIKHVAEAESAGHIYTPENLIPYPEAVYVRERSSSLPSYTSRIAV